MQQKSPHYTLFALTNATPSSTVGLLQAVSLVKSGITSIVYGISVGSICSSFGLSGNSVIPDVLVDVVVGTGKASDMVELTLLHLDVPLYLCRIAEAADSIPVITNTPAINPPIIIVRAASNHSFILLCKCRLRLLDRCKPVLDEPATVTGRSSCEAMFNLLEGHRFNIDRRLILVMRFGGRRGGWRSPCPPPRVLDKDDWLDNEDILGERWIGTASMSLYVALQ
jgi:hypothetical protein